MTDKKYAHGNIHEDIREKISPSSDELLSWNIDTAFADASIVFGNIAIKSTISGNAGKILGISGLNFKCIFCDVVD